MRPEVKTQFFKAADALGLDEATRDLTWRRMNDLGMTPDDPTTIFLAVGGLLEAAAITIPDAVNALPSKVEAAARRAVGPVADAAASKVRADMGSLADDLGRDVGASVAAAAIAHIDSNRTAVQLKVSGGLVAGAIVLALLCSMLGYSWGRSNVSSITAEWQGVVARADAGTWVSLANANPDLTATLRAACAPGAKAAYLVQGARACNVPLWLEPPAASEPGPVAGVYLSVLDWLAGYRPMVVLLTGILGGLLVRRAAKLVVSGGPLAWLLDL